MLPEIAVVLLCLVPFVENRGAMFVGFALGVVHPAYYIIGTLLEFVEAAIYLRFLPVKPLLWLSGVQKELKRKGPLLFIPLFVMPANGVNSFTAAIAAKAAGFDRAVALAAICAAITARGLVTYLMLYGALTASEYLEIGGYFQLALFALVIVFAASAVWNHLKR